METLLYGPQYREDRGTPEEVMQGSVVSKRTCTLSRFKAGHRFDRNISPPVSGTNSTGSTESVTCSVPSVALP